jgi:excisionase family DNA binding protein
MSRSKCITTHAMIAPEAIRPQEFARRLGISVWTARQWAYRGKISSCKVGKLLLIPTSEITRLLSENLRPWVSEQ